jgi:ABC-type transport system involved in cytochrome c biogenesis permease component
MPLNLLPIVERELRVAARRKRTYSVRVQVVLLTLLLAGWSALMAGAAWRGYWAQMGQAVFQGLAALGALYCGLAGVGRTADCLSREKREGTLGFLFLTDLKGHDVVLGKVAATSLNAVLGLLAAFPVLAVALLLGGVTAGEFWRTVLSLLNLLFFSLAAGILVSALSHHERKAAVGALCLLAGLVLAPAALSEGYCELARTSPAPPIFWITNPLEAFNLTQAASYASRPGAYWASLLGSHLMGWGLVGLASFLAARTWHETGRHDAPAGLSNFRLRWRFGSVKRRQRLRARWLDVSPFCWLALRDRTKPAWVWLALAAVAGCFATDVFFDFAAWRLAPFYLLPAFCLHLVVKLFVTSEASRRFLDDRRNGTLELLLCAPLSVKEILRGQWVALRQQFTGPVIAVLLCDDVLLVAGVHEGSTLRGLNTGSFVVLFCMGAAVFVVDVIALGWVGLWEGLKRQNAQQAFTGAMGPVLVGPWAATWLAVALYSLSMLPTGGPWFGWSARNPVLSCATLWFLISLLTAAWFGWSARRQLLQHFRREVARQFQPVKRRWWARSFFAEETPAQR